MKPQTFGNRPTDIDEISDPPSPPTTLGALPDAPPPKIVEAAVSPPVYTQLIAPLGDPLHQLMYDCRMR